MTNKQIFEKAIKIAVENDEAIIKSYPKRYPKGFFKNDGYYHLIFNDFFATVFATYLLKEKAVSPEHQQHLLIIDPLGVFAKTANKQELIEDIKRRFLQAMVLETKPLKYIEKFL